MAGIRWPPEEPELFPSRPMAGAGGGEAASDDDRSVAADSWSIRSDYGSTLDDDQRHADAAEVLSTTSSAAAGAGVGGAHYRVTSDFSFDKDVPDSTDGEVSMLSLQNYADAGYAEENNFHEHSHADDDWFGVEVMDILVGWTKNLCSHNDLSSWSVLDVGTGNGRLLQQLAKQGFSDLTGIDYSEGAIELARNLAIRDGFGNINFLVDDVLESKLERIYQLVMDEGTLDAIGLHPDGPVKRMMYWESVAHLVSPGGILVITSCSSSKDELVQEVENFNQRKTGSMGSVGEANSEAAIFRYLDHVQNYPSIEGSHIVTVAFVQK